MSRGFEFRESWLIPFAPGPVRDVLVDLEHYPEWWPQVVAVAKLDDDNARVLCRSSLPYTLDLVLTAVSRGPTLLETTIRGDLVGSVSWRVADDPAGTRLDYEQRVEVGHRLLRALSTPMRGVLAWNHARMMAGCRVGLLARLAEA